MNLIQLAGLDFDAADPRLTVTFWRENDEDLKIETSPEGSDALTARFAKLVSEGTFKMMEVGTRYEITMSFDAGCTTKVSGPNPSDPHDQRVLTTLKEETRLGFVEPLEKLTAMFHSLPSVDEFRSHVVDLSRHEFIRAALEGRNDLLATGQRTVKGICGCGRGHNNKETEQIRGKATAAVIPGVGIMLEIDMPDVNLPIGTIGIRTSVDFHDPFFAANCDIMERAGRRVLEGIEPAQLQELHILFDDAAKATREYQPIGT